MPVSLIEAGMCGTPCVATNVGSVSEVVLDGVSGRVVSTEASEIAAAVSDLLERADLRQQYGRAARSHTHGNFSMDRLVSTTEDVYRRVLGDDSRH